VLRFLLLGRASLLSVLLLGRASLLVRLRAEEAVDLALGLEADHGATHAIAAEARPCCRSSYTMLSGVPDELASGDGLLGRRQRILATMPAGTTTAAGQETLTLSFH
jgi:hypothetical protein